MFKRIPKPSRVTAACLISAALLFAILWNSGVADNLYVGAELWTDLCDSFFAVGSLFICWGLLQLAYKKGHYNFFSYNSRLLMSFFFPQSREAKPVMSYYDYTTKKAEERKDIKVAHVMLIGGAYLAVSLVFLLLYLYLP